MDPSHGALIHPARRAEGGDVTRYWRRHRAKAGIDARAKASLLETPALTR